MCRGQPALGENKTKQKRRKTQHCAQADNEKFNRNNSNIYSKPMARIIPIPWDA